MNDRTVKSKVVIPALRARTEKGNQNASLRIERADIRAFVTIAAETGQRQIVSVSLTAMLQRYDMVRLVLMRGC